MTEHIYNFNKVRLAEANSIISRNVLWALGAGTVGSFVPVPLADAALIGAVQLRLVAQLSTRYGVPFHENAAKGVIGSLIGGLAPGLVAGAYTGLIRMVPVIGHYLALATLPLFGAATTYALGKVFVQHFEIGGTFLDFNPDANRKYFLQQFEDYKNSEAERKAEAEKLANQTPSPAGA
jgi:uncharacterized protein (DUF697 family)